MLSSVFFTNKRSMCLSILQIMTDLNFLPISFSSFSMDTVQPTNYQLRGPAFYTPDTQVSNVVLPRIPGCKHNFAKFLKHNNILTNLKLRITPLPVLIAVIGMTVCR